MATSLKSNHTEQVKGVCASWLNLEELAIYYLCLAKLPLLMKRNSITKIGRCRGFRG